MISRILKLNTEHPGLSKSWIDSVKQYSTLTLEKVKVGKNR